MQIQEALRNVMQQFAALAPIGRLSKEKGVSELPL